MEGICDIDRMKMNEFRLRWKDSSYMTIQADGILIWIQGSNMMIHQLIG